MGHYGSCSDAQIFNASNLKRALTHDLLSIPPAEQLPGDGHSVQSAQKVPYFLVGDDAFPLCSWLMKPYSPGTSTLNCLPMSQRVFNYRLSRARRVVENSFGILAQRWRCLLTALQQEVNNAQDIIKCSVLLHNFVLSRQPDLIRAQADTYGTDGSLHAGGWRVQDSYLPDPPQPPCHDLEVVTAAKQRDYLAEYCHNMGGEVDWQSQYIMGI